MDGNGETNIFYVMIWNHPTETTNKRWLFRVPGYDIKTRIPSLPQFADMIHNLLASQPTPPQRTPPRNKALLSPNRALLNPYFWGGGTLLGGTWRIIPLSKPFRPFIRGITPSRGRKLITMVINHLLTNWDDPPSRLTIAMTIKSWLLKITTVTS